jgi:hypothetical protein
MLKELKYEIITNYPKGTSRHYDTDNPISAIKESEVNKYEQC